MSGGTKEILKNDCGVLLQSFDDTYSNNEKIEENEKELANKILELIENQEKASYYKKMSYERIKDFSNKNIKEKWIKIIEN